MWEAQHEDGAKKLYDITSELKGFYVKTAQIISSRQDLFPKQYTDALSGFTDNFEPMPASLARAVVTQELLNRGESFEDIFSEFDDVPLGAYVKSFCIQCFSFHYRSNDVTFSMPQGVCGASAPCRVDGKIWWSTGSSGQDSTVRRVFVCCELTCFAFAYSAFHHQSIDRVKTAGRRGQSQGDFQGISK
jgi:hypothetical protein